MAEIASVSPILSTRRSTQSGNKALTAAYVVEYTEFSTAPWVFMGADIDLTTMADGDVVDIRIQKRIAFGGALVVADVKTYHDAQPADHLLVSLGSMINTYGIEISMRQTAGALRTIPCEFYDSKRLGA